ncbi:hypothetical protein CAPTEDRAFT_192626, partial [Capitella teleta]
MIRLINIAHPKFFISNPSTSLLEKTRIKALMTQVNNPSVRIVIGSASIIRMGLTRRFKQVFLNATILTMDKENSVAEAILVERGIITAVGSEEAVLNQASSEAEHIDLAGKTMLPGFIEAHGHFPGSGLSAVAADLNSPPIGNTLSINDAVKALKVMGGSTPEGEWIIGFGFDDTMIMEKRFLSKEDLDQ